MKPIVIWMVQSFYQPENYGKGESAQRENSSITGKWKCLLVKKSGQKVVCVQKLSRSKG